MSGRDERVRIADDLGGRLRDSDGDAAHQGDDGNDSTRQAIAQRYKAEQWRHRHPDAWEYLVRLALNEVSRKRKFSVQYLIEEVRRKSFVDEEGAPSVVNNTLRPALTRLLIDEHPEVAPYVETRRATCDMAFQEPS